MIEGVRFVRDHAGHGLGPDPSLPWKVTINLRPPEFMGVAFAMLYGGSEEFVFQAPTREHIDELIEQARKTLDGHPRLRWVLIEGPDTNEKHTKYPKKPEET